MEDETHSDNDSYEKSLKTIHQFMNKRQYFYAHDYIQKCLTIFTEDVQLNILNGENYLRIKGYEKSKESLEQTLNKLKKKPLSGETTNYLIQVYHLLGDLYLELWREEKENLNLELSLKHFNSCFALQKIPEIGILIELICYILKLEFSIENIQSYIQQLRMQTPHPNSSVYIGLAYLLMSDQNNAFQCFNFFKEKSAVNYFAINEVFSIVKELTNQNIFVSDEILNLLTPPSIVVCEGLNLFQLSSVGIEYTPEFEAKLKDAIKKKLDFIDAKIGFCSGAAGTDILFAETMLERGGQVKIVIPYNLETFIKNNVSNAGEIWTTRFEALLAKSASISYTTDDKPDIPTPYHHLAYLMKQGMALKDGNLLLSEVYLLLVWDPLKSSESTELVNKAFDFWSRPQSLITIDLDDFVDHYHNIPSTFTQAEVPEEESFFKKHPMQIKSLLYSDLVGYSRFKNNHIAQFLTYLELVREQLDLMELNDVYLETQGDCIMAIMNSALDTAKFSLILSDIMHDVGKFITDYPEAEMRIALHTGLVFNITDPISLNKKYYGQSITRAARLEPVTIPGLVYATSEFISLLMLELFQMKSESEQKGSPFSFPIKIDYVGNIQLAKKYGIEPVYRIRRNPIVGAISHVKGTKD